VQGDDDVEAGSPIIAKQALPKDPEYFGLAKKYKSAEEPERHRLMKKVRRAQLRSSDGFGGDGNRASSASALDMRSLPAADVDSDHELDSNLDNDDERTRELKKKWTIWERSLPKATVQLDPEPPANSSYTFIESDETPTRTYEQKHYDRKQTKSTIRQKLPFR
jgi:hypothetical protein